MGNRAKVFRSCGQLIPMRKPWTLPAAKSKDMADKGRKKTEEGDSIERSIYWRGQTEQDEVIFNLCCPNFLLLVLLLVERPLAIRCRLRQG